MALKMMIFLAIIGCGGLFFLKGPTGKPFLSMDTLFSSPVETTLPSAPTKIYKWQDENGVWQFSNTPVNEKNVETMELDGKINTMDAFKAPRTQTATKPKNQFSSVPSGMLTISSDQLSDMMETVNGLQETVDKRKEQMDKVAGKQ